jgi:hypothetical protein
MGSEVSRSPRLRCSTARLNLINEFREAEMTKAEFDQAIEAIRQGQSCGANRVQ